MGEQSPITWEEYNLFRAGLSEDELNRGMQEGQWPEGTPLYFPVLETRMTPKEKAFIADPRATPELRLLRAMFGERGVLSIEEVLSRPSDYLAKLEEEEQERAKQVKDDSVKMLEGQLEKLLEPLTEIERRFMRKNFGLEDGRSHTDEQLAEEEGMSVEEVKGVFEGAYRKLHKAW